MFIAFKIFCILDIVHVLFLCILGGRIKHYRLRVDVFNFCVNLIIAWLRPLLLKVLRLILIIFPRSHLIFWDCAYYLIILNRIYRWLLLLLFDDLVYVMNVCFNFYVMSFLRFVRTCGYHAMANFHITVDCHTETDAKKWDQDSCYNGSDLWAAGVVSLAILWIIEVIITFVTVN